MRNTISVEVAPDGWGGWKVTLIHVRPHDTTQEILVRTRLKRSARKIGRYYAKRYTCELRVKNRKGQYTTDAASFGNDPRRSKG